MSKHYLVEKKEKTLRIFERALDFLVDARAPIFINNKMYKKINFSYAQIIATMNHVSTPEELVDELVWTDNSSVSKYKEDIEKMKLKRINILLTSNDFKLERELNNAELKLKLEQLMAANRMLERENENLRSAITQHEEIGQKTKTEQVVTLNNGEPPQTKELKIILKNLLEILVDDGQIRVAKSEIDDSTLIYSYASQRRSSVNIAEKSKLDKILN